MDPLYVLFGHSQAPSNVFQDGFENDPAAVQDRVVADRLFGHVKLGRVVDRVDPEQLDGGFVQAEVGVVEELVQDQIEIDDPLLLDRQDRGRVRAAAAEVLLEGGGQTLAGLGGEVELQILGPRVQELGPAGSIAGSKLDLLYLYLLDFF